MVFKRFVSLFRSKWVKLGLFFFLFMIAALIAIAMLLGREAGYFSIKTQSGNVEKSISLSLDPEDSRKYTSGLQAKAIDDFDQTSPAYLIENQMAGVKSIHRDKVTDTKDERYGQDKYIGNIRIEKAFGYSFYLINTSSNNTSVGVDMSLTMTRDNGLGKAIRVLTYCEYDGKEHFSVYQMEDEVEQVYKAYSYVYGRDALKTFNSTTTTIFSDERLTVSGDSGKNYLKYTILFWLEGDDPDCTESILGKSAKFELKASVDMAV